MTNLCRFHTVSWIFSNTLPSYQHSRLKPTNMFHSFNDLNRFSVWYSKKGLNLWEVTMIEQIKKHDKTMIVRLVFLEKNYSWNICLYYVHNMFIAWSFVHNLFQFGPMINHWMKLALQLLLRNKYNTLYVSRTLWPAFYILLTNTCSKLKV